MLREATYSSLNTFEHEYDSIMHVDDLRRVYFEPNIKQRRYNDMPGYPY